MWTQGEWFHPGIVDRAQELVDAVGVPLDIRTAGRHGAATLCYSNYWVANERFWDAYVGGVLVPIAELVEGQPESPVVRRVMEETLHTTPAPFLPFIAERLFTTFLAEHREFTTAALPARPRGGEPQRLRPRCSCRRMRTGSIAPTPKAISRLTFRRC